MVGSAREDQLVAVAKAEDTYDLLRHIAWTDVIKPQLERELKTNSELLISDALGVPNALGGKTREQVAGMCYGITRMISLFESILTKGEKALASLRDAGIALTN